MIKQTFPLFESGNLLTKEMLTSIRDYSFGYSQLLYQGYSNGILKGCQIITTQDTIGIEKGIIIYEGKLYLVNKSMWTKYYPTNQTAIFKLKFGDEIKTQNFISQEVEPQITQDLTLHTNELEICRFKLQQGSKLRVDYKDFQDRETEFDTVNVIYSPYAAYGESSISPTIITDFARRLSKCKNLEGIDMTFCMQALNSQDMALSKECIATYIKGRLELEENPKSNHECFNYLCKILDSVEQGKRISHSRINSKTRILID